MAQNSKMKYVCCYFIIKLIILFSIYFYKNIKIILELISYLKLR